MHYPTLSASEQSSTRMDRNSNPLFDYYSDLSRIIDECVTSRAAIEEYSAFNPGFDLPKLDSSMRDMMACAETCWWSLGSYKGRHLHLLDLMRNPHTQTTKTFASLLIVARAISYIRRTGKTITILCPTSGNKGLALRDAVARAITSGMVKPYELRIIILVPKKSVPKLRSSKLSRDSELSELNPVFVYDGPEADGVKDIARKFVDLHSKDFHRQHNSWLWYSLDIRNYKIADALRAFFENDASPTSEHPRRVHAHSVSSAYGLLGYNLGRDVLERDGHADRSTRPGFLLVQHLGTPDMVLSNRFESFDRSNLPEYVVDSDTGLFKQKADDHFPHEVKDLAEAIDQTFYTHRPPTSLEMNSLIAEFGGTGIVVSQSECLQRYAWMKDVLRLTDIRMPENANDLTECSLLMAFTGVANAIDRGLLPDCHEVVVHGSGCYSHDDYEHIGRDGFTEISSVQELTDRLLK